MKILLVEDNSAVSSAIQFALEKEKHNVLSANNLSKAKTIYEQDKPDCLIVDLNMEPVGLTCEEAKLTQGGHFTGWIWLKNYVFKENSLMQQCTVILTAYYEEFSRWAKEKNEDITRVQILWKRDDVEEDRDEILNRIKEIQLKRK